MFTIFYAVGQIGYCSVKHKRIPISSTVPAKIGKLTDSQVITLHRGKIELTIRPFLDIFIVKIYFLIMTTCQNLEIISDNSTFDINYNLLLLHLPLFNYAVENGVTPVDKSGIAATFVEKSELS